MLNSIIHNLKSPHKIPIKILRKVIWLYKIKNYSAKTFEMEQNKKFVDLKLNRAEGKKKLDLIKNKYLFLNRGMSSEHELLFSSISLKKDIKIENILEIGTFDAANAFLLSKLFENSIIDTLDLSSDESNFKDFYNRGDNLDKFISDRNNMLLKNNNINFIEQNSVKLTFSKKKYDLVWIDGAHGYPVCCIDIMNSLKLLNEKGHILVDDILTENDINHRMYDSTAGFETLKELENNKIIKFNLFYKRLDAKSNCEKKKIKYVALVKKLG